MQPDPDARKPGVSVLARERLSRGEPARGGARTVPNKRGRERWREIAEDGIETNRKGDIDISVRDWSGRPVPGVLVRARMKQHAFMFGTAVHTRALTRPGGRRFRQHLLELFNTVVFGNEMKWRRWEDVLHRRDLDRALAWVRSRGLRIRGHTMLWPTMLFGKQLPGDVLGAVERGDPKERKNIMRRTLAHVHRIGRTYDAVVEEWEVLNEQCEQNVWTRYLTPRTPVTNSPALLDLFEAAREAAPSGRLFLNEYHILVGRFRRQRDTYEEIIRFLLKRGAPLGGVGMQCHYHHRRHLITPGEIRKRLDRFGQFGLPITVTEYDTFGDGWPGDRHEREQVEAEFFERFLLTLFSHPAAQGFLVWGFWQGEHWQKNAPFLRMDWSPKPAGEVYRRYVLNEWKTDESVVTDAEGHARIRGFHGDYDVHLRHAGTTWRMTDRLVPGISRWDYSIGR